MRKRPKILLATLWDPDFDLDNSEALKASFAQAGWVIHVTGSEEGKFRDAALEVRSRCSKALLGSAGPGPRGRIPRGEALRTLLGQLLAPLDVSVERSFNLWFGPERLLGGDLRSESKRKRPSASEMVGVAIGLDLLQYVRDPRWFQLHICSRPGCGRVFVARHGATHCRGRDCEKQRQKSIRARRRTG